MSQSIISEVFNEDCLIGMARYPDKFFDLAIVDPPYGIGLKGNMGRRKGDAKSELQPIKWDDAPPTAEYFHQLFRVSKNQIIWGANHFISLIPIDSPCWIVWDKWISEDVSFAQVELAWTSFSSTAKKFTKARPQEVRIHDTQKPVGLYKWLLARYGNGGGHILDTHMGSQSSRIAAYDMGFHYTGFELDPDYFIAGNKRFAEHTAQGALFSDPALYTTGPDY